MVCLWKASVQRFALYILLIRYLYCTYLQQGCRVASKTVLFSYMISL